MKLGELIVQRRKKKGMTLRELSRVSGVSNPTISQIETGWTEDPGFKSVMSLRKALGISLKALVETG